MKWTVKITEIGKEVQELLDTSKQFDLVIEGKREDMRDFTIHFEGSLPSAPLCEGDEVMIGDTALFIVAMGTDVNDHLQKHGACTIDLSGGLVPKSPCTIMLDGTFRDIDFLKNGTTITIL